MCDNSVSASKFTSIIVTRAPRPTAAVAAAVPATPAPIITTCPG